MTNDSDNNATFIKPIQKKPTAHLPVLASPPAAGVDYDPIQRLNEELSRLNKTYQEVAGELAALKERQDKVEARPLAATVEQVKELANQPRTVNLNAEKFAHYVQPALVASLPSSEQLQAATQAGADAIREAGTSAAQLIGEAATTAASRIQVASDVKTHSFLGRVWFKSWREAGIVLSVLLVLVGSIAGVIIWQQRAVLNAQQETEAVREFTDWVKAQPEGKKLYDRYYNR